MKGKIISTLVIILLLILVDFIFFNLSIGASHKVRIAIIHFLISSVLFFLLFVDLIYKKWFTMKSKNYVIIIFIVLPLILAMHVSDRIIAINKYYLFSKNQTSKIGGELWEPDPLLGYKGIPDSHGSYDYYIGDSIHGSIPVYFNSSGYRTVGDSLKIKGDTLDLFVGCSYTFGDLIEAKNGYPYLVSESLGHDHINAGGSGYGFGQMIQLIETLTKKHSFKYVFIQLSPWLSERAMYLKSTNFYGYKPFPYFSDDGSGFKLNPPSFPNMKLSNRNWRLNKPNYLEKFRFSFSDGFKSEIIDYYAYQFANLKVKMGIIPAPTKRRIELEQYFYDHVIDVCIKNKAIPVILKIEYPREKHRELLDHLAGKAQMIDLDYPLERMAIESHLPYDVVRAKTNYEKNKSLYHISGKDSIIYDDHPNDMANKSFAERIFSELNK